MPTEQYANNPSTTLNGAINNAVTTLVVASATGFSTGGNFRILIDTELLLVTAVSGTTFTVTRGAEGTTAASHVDASAVVQVLTRDSLKGLGAGIILSDVYANLPAAGTEGKVYLPTEGGHVLRDDGSAWQGFGPLNKMQPPVDSALAWVNQGANGSIDATASGYILKAVSTGASDCKIRKQAAPAAPFTATLAFRPLFNVGGFQHYGLVSRNSGSGKLVILSWLWNGGAPHWEISKWNSATSFSASYTLGDNDAGSFRGDGMIWLRVVDDNVNRVSSVSRDGINWLQVHSVGRTDFLTADEVGFDVNPDNLTTSLIASMTVYHWKVG